MNNILNFKNVTITDVLENWEKYESKNNCMNDFIKNIVEDLVNNDVVYVLHNKLTNTDITIIYDNNCKSFVVNDEKVCLKYAISNILIANLIVNSFKIDFKIYDRDDYVNQKAKKIIDKICMF